MPRIRNPGLINNAPLIRRLARHEVDDHRWNAAVTADPAALPYGLTHWMDAATGAAWEGLVADDYRLVLPLPDLRRFGMIPVYNRPPYTQQLGPFGPDLQPGDVAAMLAVVPFRMEVCLPLVATLPPEEIPDRFHFRKRTNFELDLSPDWPEIAARFPRKLQAFLRRTESQDRLEPLEPEVFVDLSRDLLAERAGLRERDLAVLHRLMVAARTQGFGEVYQLREAGELLAAGFFPKLGGRTINLATVTTERGRKRRGNSRLLARVMQLSAGTPGAVFDFEGSELPGVRAFFAKFGGTDRGYYLLEAKPFRAG